MDILFAICREKDATIESLQRQINILQEEVMRLQNQVKQDEEESVDKSEQISTKQQITSPRKFVSIMRELSINDDIEGRHGKMDDAMCALLCELGYSTGVKIFNSVEKYYA